MLRHWSQLVPNNYVNRHPRTLSNATALSSSFTISHLDCGVADVSGDLVMTPFDGDWPWARGLIVNVGWFLRAFPSTLDRVHLLLSILLHTPRRACYELVLHTEKGRLCTCATHRGGHVMYLCYTSSWGCYVLVLHMEKGMLCTCATRRVGHVMYLCYTPSWGCYVLVLHT